MIEIIAKIYLEPKKIILECENMSEEDAMDNLEEKLIKILEDEIVSDQFDEIDWEVVSRIIK